jgi:tetratricopeptide (TPR) repeat protein
MTATFEPTQPGEPEPPDPRDDVSASHGRASPGDRAMRAGGAGAGNRGARSGMRRRLVTACGVLVIAALAAALAASLWQTHAAQRARDEARQQAMELKRLSTELVYRQGDLLARLPGGAAPQEAMLKQTLGALEVALAAAPDDADMQALVASALGRLAEIQVSERSPSPARTAEAEATVARALALAEPVWMARRADGRFARWHVRTLGLQARLLRARGQPAEALKPLALAIERCGQALSVEPPISPEGRAHLMAERGAAHLEIAGLQFEQRQPEAALKSLDLAEADHRRLLDDNALLTVMAQDAAPGDPSPREALTQRLAALHAGRARVHERLDDLDAMRREAEAAVALRTEALARDPRHLASREGLVSDGATLALALLRLGQPEAALQAAQRSRDAARRLAEDAGSDARVADPEPTIAPVLGRAQAATGDHAAALASYELALARWSADLARQNDPALRLRVALLQVRRAVSLHALGEGAVAEGLLATAVAALRGMAAPSAPGADTLHRDALLALAEGLMPLAEWTPAEAAALRGEAVAALKEADHLRRLAADHRRLLDALAAPG